MSYRSLFRRVVTRSRRPRSGAPPLAIFLYHSVVRRQLEVEDFCFIREEEFRAQVETLKRRFRLVSLTEAARLLDQEALEEPTAVVTFDDGFQDNFDVAYPVLAALGVPATIFLCTDLLDTPGALWYCRLHDAITRTSVQELEWGGRRHRLDDGAAKSRTADLLKRELKRLRHPDLEVAVDEITARLELSSDAGADARFRMLSRAAIREMTREKLIELGAHTGSHAILARLSAREQRDEIERSLREVGALTGSPCRLFAYPNGRFEDYDGDTLEILRGAGVEVAVTAERGSNDASTPPLELLRIPIGGEPSMPLFERELRRFRARSVGTS